MAPDIVPAFVIVTVNPEVLRIAAPLDPPAPGPEESLREGPPADASAS